MKLQIWDILSIVFLALAVIVVGVVAAIFADPHSALNPFPPGTLPARLMLPTATNTPRRLPATWTPVGWSGNSNANNGTLAASSTPQPSPTGFILPTSTNTTTNTPTVTSTRTATKIPSSTPQPTPNLQATNSYLQTQIVGGLTATSAIATVHYLQTLTAVPTK